MRTPPFLRSLRRHPGLVLSVVLCLALGLGANLMMLGVVDVLLFRPPAHVSEPEEVRRLYFTSQRAGQGESASSIHVHPLLESLVLAREEAAGAGEPALEHVAAFHRSEVPFGEGPDARPIFATFVSGEFFGVVGTSPQLGRTFSSEESRAESNPYCVLLSHELHQQLGGDPDVLGTEVSLDDEPYTVIGVMPPGFTGLDVETVALWLPLGAVDPLLLADGWEDNQNHYFLFFVGRLAEGVSPVAAEARLTGQYREITGWGERVGVRLGPIQSARGPRGSADTRIALWLTALSAAILLIACANVSQLLITYNLRRRRELAVRLGMGANRGALLRRILLESGVLALLGGVGALLVLVPLHRLLGALLLPPAVAAQPLDLRLLGGLVVLCAAVAFLCALAPALWLLRENLLRHLRGGNQGTSHREARLRASLLVGQVALTLMLLVGAGLFVRSLLEVAGLDLGLDGDRVLVVDLDLERRGYPLEDVDAAHRRARELLSRVGSVESAAVSNAVPFRSFTSIPVEVPGVPEPSSEAVRSPTLHIVDGPYFATLGASLVGGRAFTEDELAGRGSRVAVVGETMARLYWPEEEALGRCLQVGGGDAPCSTVVGVVEDVRRTRLQEGPVVQYYVPLVDAPETFHPSRYLLVRTRGRAASRVDDVRRELQALAPDLPFFDVTPLEDLILRQQRSWRLGAWLFSLFGALALVLALLGLVASVRDAITRRRRELGIRMALGADRRVLSRWLLGRAMRWPLVGVAVGLVLVVLAAPLLQPLLFEVSPLDPWVLAAVVLLFTGGITLASYLPARRVRGVDPGRVLDGT